ncbi:MAG: plasmid mobilization relaxosome protein MobC [Clostridia bacterium]|nr:plasmid mobilization relaxosome protein MobC [Clostridia bacterium]MBR3575846.1 plasmid mobilization relaxosome protein MobC [Clostridia bacterium]
MSSENIASKGSEKKENRVRNKFFNVRLTASELEKINKKIKKSKLSKADFLMKIADKKEIIVVDELSKSLKEFRKQGTNLNQIAKALNGYYLQLREYGLETYAIEEDFQKFYSEVLKLREKNMELVEMLNELRKG